MLLKVCIRAIEVSWPIIFSQHLGPWKLHSKISPTWGPLEDGPPEISSTVSVWEFLSNGGSLGYLPRGPCGQNHWFIHFSYWNMSSPRGLVKAWGCKFLLPDLNLDCLKNYLSVSQGVFLGGREVWMFPKIGGKKPKMDGENNGK